MSWTGEERSRGGQKERIEEEGGEEEGKRGVKERRGEKEKKRGGGEEGRRGREKRRREEMSCHAMNQSGDRTLSGDANSLLLWFYLLALALLA